jgi:hypothetical protein
MDSATGREVTYTIRNRGCRSSNNWKSARSSIAWVRVPREVVVCARLIDGTTTTDSSS